MDWPQALETNDPGHEFQPAIYHVILNMQTGVHKLISLFTPSEK